MAFVHEMISLKDIEKYSLKELISKYQQWVKDTKADNIIIWDNIDSWIVDRESETWLVPIGTYIDPSYLPTPMSTGEQIHILHYKGEDIEVHLERDRQGGSRKRSDNPFIIKWNILSLAIEESSNINTEEAVDIITEALIARGDGMSVNLPEPENVILDVKYQGVE